MDPIDKIKEAICIQLNGLAFCGTDATYMHRLLIYRAFQNLALQCPDDMAPYLFGSRRGGMQHRLFQEYFRLLEESIPFFFQCKRGIHWVHSLLDDDLNVFDGLSVFDAVISDKRIIKNDTKEFYIGGRSGYCSRPFYIGKLLDVRSIENDASLLSDVSSYSFSQIKMKEISPGTMVRVSHLRIVPHYQAGAMAPINRIRKRIVQALTEAKSSPLPIEEQIDRQASHRDAIVC